MRRLLVCTLFVNATFTNVTAVAADHADAQISVACSGKSGATVALRWGSPNYDSDPIKFMDRFTVHCDGPGLPKTQHPLAVKVTAPDSTFEIQTEGGIETSYNVKVTLNSQKPPLTNSFTLVHTGSPTTVSSQNGFNLTRSAGPNKYGEQNFRFALTIPPPVTAKVELQSGGNRGDAQVALRWGHPNYDSKGFIKLWKVKPGPSQTQQFQITDAKSEFELQTEGGEGTTYSMKVWLDKGHGFVDGQAIDIEHSLNTQPDFSDSVTDITFDPTHGNIYGEGNVKVHAPWISSPIQLGPPTGGLNIRFDNGTAPVGTQNSFIDISFTGKLVPGTSPSGSTGNSAIDKTLTRQTVNSGLDNIYSDPESGLQPGSWNVSVSPVANGVLLNPTNCTGVKIVRGQAPFLLVDGARHTCRLQ